MTIIGWIKLGVVIALIGAAGYFVLNYKHMQTTIKTLKTQVEEQHKAIEFYEKAAKIDKETASVHQQIQEAVNANDTDRVRALYKQLSDHQRAGQSKPTSKTKPR